MQCDWPGIDAGQTRRASQQLIVVRLNCIRALMAAGCLPSTVDYYAEISRHGTKITADSFVFVQKKIALNKIVETTTRSDRMKRASNICQVILVEGLKHYFVC